MFFWDVKLLALFDERRGRDWERRRRQQRLLVDELLVRGQARRAARRDAAAAPERWEAIVATDKLLRDNRETIETCRKSATKAKKPVRCTIEVKPAPE